MLYSSWLSTVTGPRAVDMTDYTLILERPSTASSNPVPSALGRWYLAIAGPSENRPTLVGVTIISCEYRPFLKQSYKSENLIRSKFCQLYWKRSAANGEIANLKREISQNYVDQRPTLSHTSTWLYLFPKLKRWYVIVLGSPIAICGLSYSFATNNCARTTTTSPITTKSSMM